METTKQAFAERINDQSKVSLSYTFIKSIKHTAFINKLSNNDVWEKWQEYTRDCRNYDQSPVYYEFLEWNSLIKD